MAVYHPFILKTFTIAASWKKCCLLVFVSNRNLSSNLNIYSHTGVESHGAGVYDIYKEYFGCLKLKNIYIPFLSHVHSFVFELS